MQCLLGGRGPIRRSPLREFRTHEGGNVAIIFALVAVALMLVVGAAIDVGRWLHARDQTAAAVDAAVLAGGRALQVNSMDRAAAIAAAQKYYQQNVASRLPVVSDNVSFAVTDNGMAVTANGTAYIKTPFLQFASIDKLPLHTRAKAEMAVGGNGGENIEVSLMLDVTGSMCMPCSKLQAMKDAAKDLVDILIWKDQSKYTSKLALVPFAEDIRLPSSSVLNAARGSNLPKTKTVTTGSGWSQQSKTYYLSDCVVERIGNQRYTDAKPSRNQYVMAHYTEEKTGSGNNVKGVCKVPASAAVVPLSSDANMLKSKIDGLNADAATAGHLGTAWAWYTLSPTWASLWPSASQPVAYGTADTRKIAILMTDGAYNSQYDSNGTLVNFDNNVSTHCPQAANGCSTQQALQLCQAMKQKGIAVYTILFGQSNNQTAVNTMKTCASDSTKFYNAGDEVQLKQAFRDIALKLSSLYLSQ